MIDPHSIDDQRDGEEDDGENPLRAPALRMPPRKPSRSGRNLTDAERARNGYGRITLRLPAATIMLLGILADEAGLSRAKYVTQLVDAADLEHARRHAENASDSPAACVPGP